MPAVRKSKTLRRIQSRSALRPFAFDRVTVRGRFPNETESRPLFSFIGRIHSEFPSGPSLFDITDAAGELLGEGWYGLESCRRIEPIGAEA